MSFIINLNIIVLVIVTLAFVHGSDNLDDTDVTKESDHHVTHTSPSLGNRRMSVFPRNTHKFSVTMKTTVARSVATYKQPQKSIKFTITPTNTKIRNISFWKTVSTRRPLMRHIQFTIKPNTFKISGNLKNKEKLIERKHKSILFKKFNNTNENNDSSEEMGGSNVQKQDKEKYLRMSLSPLYKLGSKIGTQKVNDTSNSKETDSKSRVVMDDFNNTNASESEFSSEEQEDREEFIFVERKKTTQNVENAIKEDSEESDENTTLIDEETKMRQKRSINVIEEENLATTVSGFKFTGNVAPLSNDLMFRNINT